MKIFRSFLAKILIKIANRLCPDNKYISAKNLRIIPWLKANGDKTLNLDFALNSSSIVFDLGGYHGDWSYEIYNKYDCFIHIFEPVFQFYNIIQSKFPENHKKIKINQFGLSDSNSFQMISLSEEASSIYKKGANKESIQLIDFLQYIRKNNIDYIDVIKINIEGGEYDLLEYLILTGKITKLKNVLIQFHEFVPNSEKRMHNIQQSLIKTHYLTFQFPFIWENWKLKE